MGRLNLSSLPIWHPFGTRKGAILVPFGTLLAPINYTPGTRPASARSSLVLAKAGQAGQAVLGRLSKPGTPVGAREPGFPGAASNP